VIRIVVIASFRYSGLCRVATQEPFDSSAALHEPFPQEDTNGMIAGIIGEKSVSF